MNDWRGGTLAQHTIALIDAQRPVCQTLQDLIGPGLEVLQLSESSATSSRGSGVKLFIASITRDDPAYVASLAQRIGAAHPGVPVFLLAWNSSEPLAIEALRNGIADYFAPPVEMHAVAEAVRRKVGYSSANVDNGAATMAPECGSRPIIGDSLAMQSLRLWLSRVAQRDCNTLVLGETGTGKDLIAEAIHAHSPRHKKPFVSVNCAAIPETLLESELFGYERGAFTGASATTDGKIQQAHGGTIFFDEIGDMSPPAQAKMLRVIESKQVQRLGGKGSIPVDVRIVAATNQNLLQLVAEQRFRKDLYFRLSVARLELPALRERREDIPLLLEYYIRVFNRQTGSQVEGFTKEALDWLVNYDWPGNVRELKNSMEAVFLDPPQQRIDLCHLAQICEGAQDGSRQAGERDELLAALRATQWNKSRAAKKLRWSRMKIYRKMTKYMIEDREKAETSTAMAAAAC
jgi:DNA-binding NtrC family response regulator